MYYNITFGRFTPYGKMNNRGFFKKEFNTLSEFVNFYNKGKYSLYCPFLKEELSKKELKIVIIKMNSLLK